jgi:L-ascorbate metabolism protein UlaG (beta-lactamase superfamily)
VTLLRDFSGCRPDLSRKNGGGFVAERRDRTGAGFGQTGDMATARELTIEWFGCTTFCVRVDGCTLWFDTFVDRLPGAAQVGLRSTDIDDADFVFVSHAHFDHILGADTVAKNTGAPIVGSYESMRVMREAGVAEEQLWAVSGGERIVCRDGISVRVFPSLHSCLFASAELDVGAPCLGDLDVSYQDRRERLAGLWAGLNRVIPSEHRDAIEHGSSRHDGGQLNYLLETARGSVFVAASSGYWSGILRELRPDVAVLAITGRPNIDGEPYQGSLADFVTGEVEMLKPDQVVFCHHDAWMPPLPALDTGPAAKSMADRTPNAALLELEYGEAVRLG